MTRPTDAIGSARAARTLKRGDHVRLKDGRWALVLIDAIRARNVQGSRERLKTVSVGVLVNLTESEGATWLADEKVWSRSPAEQVRFMDALLGDVRTAADAAHVARAARAAGGAA